MYKKAIINPSRCEISMNDAQILRFYHKTGKTLTSEANPSKHWPEVEAFMVAKNEHPGLAEEILQLLESSNPFEVRYLYALGNPIEEVLKDGKS